MGDFTLQKWKDGAKVRTRTGQEVENLTHFPNANQYQFAGLVDGEICSWTKNGKFDHEIFEHPDDLVIAEDEMWVYLFRSLGVNVLSFKTYPNYSDALAAYTEKHQQKDLIGIFKLTEL